MNDKILDLPYLSINFPSQVKNEISRNNIIETIENIFNTDVNIVFLEGEDDIGKTTLLSQFCKRHNCKAISCFLNPTSVYSCDIELFLHDITGQLYWIVENKPLEKNICVTITFYRHLITQILKKKKYENITYFFVLDGLIEAEIFKSSFVKQIFDILPFGDNFKFLISGSYDKLNQYMPKLKNVLIHKYPLTGFGLDETINFIKEFIDYEDNERELVDELRELCQGYPGKIYNSIRIIKESKKSIKEFLNTIEKYEDLFKIDNEKINYNNRDLISILTFITFIDTIYNIESMSKILDLSPDSIRSYVNNLSFISISADDSLKYISQLHKKYFSNKLSNYKKDIIEKVINYHLSNTEDGDSLQILSSLYFDSQKWRELIDILSEETIIKIIEKKQSLSVIQKQFELGFEASKRLNNKTEMLRFSLQKSLTKELEDIDIWESEIEALISMGEINKAIGISQSILLKEDRLRLLSVLAKKLKLNNKNIPEEIIDQIKVLYTQINLNSFGDKIFELTSNLIYVLPNFVLDIINKSSEDNNSLNFNDWMLARLAISVSEPSNNYDKQLEDTFINISAKIKDPKIKKITDSIKLIFEKYTFDDIKQEINHIDDVHQKINLLKLWLQVNIKGSNISEILEFALTLLYNSTYHQVPDSNLLVTLSSYLIRVKDSKETIKIINKFDGFKDSLKKNSPTILYFKFMINLFRAELKYNYDKAINRLYEIYFEIDKIDDVQIKIELLSIVYSSHIKYNEFIQSKDKFITSIKKDIIKNLNILLNDTSLHDNILDNFITGVVRYDISIVIEYSKKLNTRLRRNFAYQKIIIEYLKQIKNNFELNVYKDIFSLIEYRQMKDDALLFLLEKLKEDKEKQELSEEVTEYLIENIKLIMSSFDKAISYAYILDYIFRRDSLKNRKETIEKLLQESFSEIDIKWRRINAAFLIADITAENCIDIAKNFLEIAYFEKSSTTFNTPSYSYPYFYLLKLIIKTFGGIIIREGNNIELELKNIKNLINKIPSISEQIELYCNLAYECQIRKRNDIRDDIVDTIIKPKLNNIIDKDEKYSLIIDYSFLFYKHHINYTSSLIEQLPNEYKELAYSNICKYLLTKISPKDSFEWSKNFKYKIKYEETSDLCDLVKKMETDYEIIFFIKHITNSITQKNLFSREQVAEIIEKIENLINEKLPDKFNIQHNGYLILAKSFLIKANNKIKNEIKYWNELIEEAKKVSSISDRAFLFATIAENMPDQLIKEKRDLIDASIIEIENIPSKLEKVKRYESILSSLNSVDKHHCKKVLQNMIKTSVVINSDDIYKIQKETIDFAYSIDPELAKELIKIIDDDPVRKMNVKDINKHIESLELKNEIINKQDYIFQDDIKNINKLISAIHMILPSFRAGLISNKSIDEFIPWLKTVLDIPFSKSYILLTYFIENAVARFEDTDQSLTYLKPFFNSLHINAKIFEVVIKKISGKEKEANYTNILIESSTNYIFRPGERNKAIKFIENWIDNNDTEYIKICDPFFSKQDLEILKILLSFKPNVKIIILTSLNQYNKIIADSIKEEYNKEWRNISEQDPPFTKVVLVWSKNTYTSPFHDRWWIINKNGLRMGTSFNSIGINKDSEISLIKLDELPLIEKECTKYINMEEQFYKNEKLEYFSFVL